MGHVWPSAEAAGGQEGRHKASKPARDACGWKTESGPYLIQRTEPTE